MKTKDSRMSAIEVLAIRQNIPGAREYMRNVLVDMSNQCNTPENGEHFEKTFEEWRYILEYDFFYEWYELLKLPQLNMYRMLGKGHILLSGLNNDPSTPYLENCVIQYLVRLRKEAIAVYATTCHRYPPWLVERVDKGLDAEGFKFLRPKYGGKYDSLMHERLIGKR